jgi:hypothetical protein
MVSTIDGYEQCASLPESVTVIIVNCNMSSISQPIQRSILSEASPESCIRRCECNGVTRIGIPIDQSDSVPISIRSVSVKFGPDWADSLHFHLIRCLVIPLWDISLVRAGSNIYFLICWNLRQR